MRRTVALLLAVLALGPVPAAAQEARDAIAEVGASALARSWRTPYRRTSAAFGYGLSGGALVLPWLEVTGSVDHSRRTSTPTDLRITNTETWILAGPRFSWWVDFVRFFGEASAGGVLRTSRYDSDAASGATRGTFGFGIGTGMSIVAASRLAFTMRVNWRHRDNQAHTALTLDVSWMFHKRSTEN